MSRILPHPVRCSSGSPASDSLVTLRALVFGLALLMSQGNVSANALGVTGLTVNQAAGTVTFTLGWDNSWWDGTNWDAAWVFVKFRDCSNAGLDFNHGLLSTIITDHTLGSFQATNAAGTPNLIEAGAGNNTGILLRRGTPGSGTISSSVTLRVTNLPATGNYDVRVFAIEMVFVSQGGFQAGDGNGSQLSLSAFSVPTFLPVPIATEAAVNLNVPGGFPAAGFPKGVNAFYVMKYEISEGQYADFLNATSTAASALRYPPFLGLNRYRLDASGTYPQNYVSQRPDRAMTYLNWADLTAYLDWATLRPMTELQYEKACRGGGGAVLAECAWGSTTSVGALAITPPGAENGAEVILTANANLCYNSFPFVGGDGGSGPIRCGIFATAATTTRVQTGASFWGAMELSGNAMELCIGVNAGTVGVSTTGVSWGDGILSALGEHNVANWPNGAAPPVMDVMPRGGSWSTFGACVIGANSCSVSNRGTAYVNAPRQPNYGGRGIR